MTLLWSLLAVKLLLLLLAVVLVLRLTAQRGRALRVVLAAAALLLFGLHLWRSRPAIADGSDPAITWYTRHHGAGYGDIDHWAYAGMPTSDALARLAQAGYACAWMPSADGGLPSEVRCTLHRSWPLPRTQLLSLRIDRDYGGRLAGAVASSTPDDGPATMLAAPLRGLHWLEPQRLEVNGLSPGEGKLLLAYLADSIAHQGWPIDCAMGDRMRAWRCSQLLAAREHGYADPDPGPLEVGSIDEVYSGLLRTGLKPVRKTSIYDTVPLRVVGRELWMDFAGQELSGATMRASLLLDSHGGAPLRLLAQLGDGPELELPLRGSGWAGNNGMAQLLLPTRLGDGAGYVDAVWLPLPSPGGNQPALDHFGKWIKAIDPAFADEPVRVMIQRAIEPEPAETLGLYPPLATMERIAAIFERAHLPEAAASTPAPIASQPAAIRAAWAIASCGAGEPVTPQAMACWMQFRMQDAEAADYLRQEVRRTEPVYAALPPNHPVLLRLERMDHLLTAEP